MSISTVLMGSLWSVEALPLLLSHGFGAIHLSNHLGFSSSSSSFPIDGLLPFLHIFDYTKLRPISSYAMKLTFREKRKHTRCNKPVEKRRGIKLSHASLQLLFYVATLLLLPQSCEAFHPNHLLCYFPL